jgi:hypothetical protein
MASQPRIADRFPVFVSDYTTVMVRYCAIPYFKRSLVGLWVQCPDHRDGDDVSHTEDVPGGKRSQRMNYAVRLRCAHHTMSSLQLH